MKTIQEGAKRAAIYARVSTEGQDADNQLLQLREFSARSGFFIAGEYVDAGVSGTKARKPELDRLLQDLRQRKFEVVVFWSLDRISRKGALDTLQLLKEIERYAAYYSYTQEWLRADFPMKDVLTSIFGELAKLERNLLVERTKAGLARARAEGKRLGRPRMARKKRLEIQRAFRETGSKRKTAKMCGVSEETVRRAITPRDNPPPLKTGEKYINDDPHEKRTFIDRGKVAGDKPVFEEAKA